MNTYLMIDGENLFRAGYSTSRQLATSYGFRTGGFFSFLRSLDVCVKKFEPKRIAVAWESYPTWRHELYPDYKANRTYDPDPILHEQREILREFLTHLPVTQIRVKGWEGDDIAGFTLANSLGSQVQDEKTVFISSDEDWLQLVSNKSDVFLYRQKKLVTAANFEKTTGAATTKLWVAAKALAGDPGDNVEGMVGVGWATALSYFLGNRKSDEIDRYIFSEEYLRSWMLVNLLPNPIPCSDQIFTYALKPEDLKVTHGMLSPSGLTHLFEKYEFKSYLNKMIEFLDRYSKVESGVIQKSNGHDNHTTH